MIPTVSASRFFAYTHLPSPHHPYLPNKDHLHSFTDDIEMSAEEAFSVAFDVYYGGSTVIKRQIASGLDLSQAEWEAVTAMYDATLRHTDETIGRLIDQARSVSEDLVIVIVGDHGDLFGEAGVIGHNLVLHDGLIRVPMVVGGVADVQTDESTLTQQIDLSYTVASITGVLGDQFEGSDIRSTERPYAISQRGEAQLDAYLRHDGSFDTDRFFETPYSIVRDDEYKSASDGERSELYHLPDEERDVSDANPKRERTLSAVLETNDIDWSTDRRQERSEFEDAQIDQLRDLGYIS